jgi:hypothetical protein
MKAAYAIDVSRTGASSTYVGASRAMRINRTAQGIQRAASPPCPNHARSGVGGGWYAACVGVPGSSTHLWHVVRLQLCADAQQALRQERATRARERADHREHGRLRSKGGENCVRHRTSRPILTDSDTVVAAHAWAYSHTSAKKRCAFTEVCIHRGVHSQALLNKGVSARAGGVHCNTKLHSTHVAFTPWRQSKRRAATGRSFPSAGRSQEGEQSRPQRCLRQTAAVPL